MNRKTKDPVLEEARRLYKMGFAILWIRPKKKNPVDSGWTTGERKPWVYLESTYKPGFNVGVRTGSPSKIKERGYLACIDVDVKDPAYQAEALEHLSRLTGDLEMPTVMSGSGNGSRHLYCVTKSHFKMVTVVKVKDRYEICIYSDGRQMVLPPSIHPSGGKYAWAGEVPELPLFEMPRVETEKPGKVGASEDDADLGFVADLATEGREDLKNFVVKSVDLEWLPISEKVMKGIVDGTDIADRSSFLLPAASALLSAGLDRDEILSVLTDPEYFLSGCAYDHAQTRDRGRAAAWLWKYTVQKVFSERTASSVFGAITGESDEAKLSTDDAKKQTTEMLAEINWRSNLDRSKQGRVQPTLKNIDLIFSNEIDGDVFIKDLFANRVNYGANTPWGGKANSPLEDIDLILVKHWLAERFGIEPSTNLILEATSLVGHRKRVHPVREWLESLEWDGVSRVNTWIKDYCDGRAEEPYLSQVSRKFLLAMVKRVFEPGCQWDYTVVLEGKQGQYKSTIARTLASDKWFMDNLPDLKDKDAMLSLQGKWLIELGELTNVKRTDYNLVKAYLSRRIDTVRAHYGRIATDVPRQTVFIGSVNEGQYLKDPTGNRRFWPVTVGMCDVAGLKTVRDQLFAETMHIYRTTTEKLMLESEEASAQAEEAQDQRRVEDDESEMRDALQEFMNSEAATEFNFERFRARELFEGPGAPWGRFNDKSYALQTAAIVLTALGFERHKIEGQRVWKLPSNPGRGIPKGGSAPPRSAPELATSDFF